MDKHHFVEKSNCTVVFTLYLIFVLGLSSAVLAQTTSRRVNYDYKPKTVTQREFDRLVQVRDALRKSAGRIRSYDRFIRDLRGSVDDGLDQMKSYYRNAEKFARQARQLRWGRGQYRCPHGNSWSRCNHTHTKRAYLAKRSSLREAAKEYLFLARRQSTRVERKVDKLKKYMKARASQLDSHQKAAAQFQRDVERYNELRKNEASASGSPATRNR